MSVKTPTLDPNDGKVMFISGFRGKDVATVLGYAHTIQALIKNVDEDDKKKMVELGNLSERLPDPNARKTMFTNESGHYS